MSSALRATRLHMAHNYSRCFATASGPSSPKAAFRETLASGPSFDDFVAGKEQDRIVLGNTKG